jgi:hypothetical protein
LFTRSIAKKKLNKYIKRAGGVTQGVGPEFKPQYCKKKKIPYSFLNRKYINHIHLPNFLLSPPPPCR